MHFSLLGEVPRPTFDRRSHDDKMAGAQVALQDGDGNYVYLIRNGVTHCDPVCGCDIFYNYILLLRDTGAPPLDPLGTSFSQAPWVYPSSNSYVAFAATEFRLPLFVTVTHCSFLLQHLLFYYFLPGKPLVSHYYKISYKIGLVLHRSVAGRQK